MPIYRHIVVDGRSPSMITQNRSFITTLLVLSSSLSLHADPITDEIDAAKKAYEAGDHSEAQTALNQAVALLTELKATAVGKALPDKIGDWTGGEIENQSAGLGLFGGGGGIMLSRPYTSGDQSVKIALSADSPLLATVGGYMGNPAMATAMGLKMHRIGDQKAMVNEKEGNATLVYKNRFLIQIENGNLKTDALLELLKGINFTALDELK